MLWNQDLLRVLIFQFFCPLRVLLVGILSTFSSSFDKVLHTCYQKTPESCDGYLHLWEPFLPILAFFLQALSVHAAKCPPLPKPTVCWGYALETRYGYNSGVCCMYPKNSLRVYRKLDLANLRNQFLEILCKCTSSSNICWQYCRRPLRVLFRKSMRIYRK